PGGAGGGGSTGEPGEDAAGRERDRGGVREAWAVAGRTSGAARGSDCRGGERMAPRHMLIALALLACGAEPGAQSESPRAGQDTVLIAGRALYVQSGFTANRFAEGVGGVGSPAHGPTVGG